VKDAHDWHLLSIGDVHVTMPLPVIIYSKTRGLSMFSSSKFHHGHESHEGYRLVESHYLHEKGLSPKVYTEGSIIAVDENNTLPVKRSTTCLLPRISLPCYWRHHPCGADAECGQELQGTRSQTGT